jgi:hypothetical protein
MKLEQSASRKLKYRALYWLRVEQRCPFIATEVGPFAADVLGINEKKIVEVEVKVSLADLKADFRKQKHLGYRPEAVYKWDQQWIPNQFYFAVPAELVEKAKFECEERGFGAYGVISLDGFTVIKRAKKLHDREPTSQVKFRTALRMGSELLRFHEAWI